MKIIEGHLKGEGLRIGIVTSRFNHFITDRLVDGALDALKKVGVGEEDITIVRVPGSFEIPMIAKQLAKQNLNAVLALGAIIKGGTSHYEYIASEVTKGIANASLELGFPIVFGILTTETIEEAIERAGTKQGNKGYEAAMSAVELANLMRIMDKQWVKDKIEKKS
ncbi:MAG: 6,7-dimethyl-8-ribityllumazine synthase [Deltaproteobacteria bacterium]|nr:6,7-dimethyl-8-ribityllumazine synthase [Deltaproteobacteria bacterium]MCL5792151.1 6,7-dimethyl-8-ribityllumazine synthase [Deltaproteobacteria bacterium]